MPRLSAGVKTDGNVLPLEQSNRLRFTAEHVARAKARAHAETFFKSLGGPRPGPAAEASPFSLPQRPPPGVVPSGDKIAQDQAGDFGGIVSWADTGFGYGNHSAFAEGQAFLGYPYLSILAQRAEYRVFSETIAEEMTRKWVKFESTNDEKTEEKKDRIKDLTTFLEDLGTRDHFRRAAELDGFFGRGHIYIDTGDGDDAEEMKMPIGNGRNKMSRSKIGKERPILALKPIEPIWTYPTRYNSSDPTSPEWYNPSEWYVMGKQFHASRLPAFVGREVPDLLKPAYAFGGLSLSQMAVPYVDNWLRTRQSVSDIVHSFVVWVLSTNMQQLMQGQGDDLFARADFFNAIRDNRGLMLLDKDTEQFQNISAPLGSLDHLQAQSQEQMCLPAGTLIETDRGYVPIENVTVLDKVRTRQGFAPIRWSGCTGKATDFIEIETNNSCLRATKHHPIWSETICGFVNAESVDPSHCLLEAQLKASTVLPWHGEVDGGGAIKTAITAIIKLADYCIECYGLRTAVLSQRTATFITSTAMCSTIALPTLNSSLDLSTIFATSAKEHVGASGSAASTKYIAKTALFAEFCTKLFGQVRRCIARLVASAEPMRTASIRSVKVKACVEQPVFNISVDEGYLPEFFANGILVHNCTVGRMPVVKFTGIEPTGLNASSEGSIRVWGETIHGMQEKLFRKNLQTIVWFAMLSLWDEIDPDIKFSFVPLAELTELEQAELRQKNAETAAKYIDSGVLSQEEERERIANDPASPWSNIDPSDVPELLEEEEAGLIPEGGGRAVAQVLGKPNGQLDKPNGQNEKRGAEDATIAGKRGSAQDAFPFRTRDGRLIEGKRGPAKAAALAVQSPTGILFVKRSNTANDHPGEWAFPAGGIKRGENLEDAARRETREETGLDYAGKTTEVCTVNAENGQSCTVFHGQVADPFRPQLDHEHSDFVWAPIDNPPLPLHPGAAQALAVMSNGDQFCV